MHYPEFEVLGDGCPVSYALFDCMLCKALSDALQVWTQFSKNATFEIDFHSRNCVNLTLEYNHEHYHLYQMQFHSPSEHSIGGGYFAAEAHMIHYSEDAGYLVLGIMLQLSAAALQFTNNSFLDRIWKAGGINSYTGNSVDLENMANPLNPYEQLMPGSPMHFLYEGSFTTPPCTEDVTWLVYESPVMISQYDLDTIRTATSALDSTTVNADGNSNRPIQPRNDRHIYMYTGAVSETEIETTTDDEYVTQADEALSISLAALCISTGILMATVYICVSVRQNRVAPKF